jgi:uncharacterized protein (TIGR03067 family)
MNAILLSLALSAPPAPPGDATRPTADALDGNWVVLCEEKDGQPVPDAKDRTVTIKGDTITCNDKDGKKHMVLRVEFGPKGTIKVADITNATPGERPETKSGVYIHTHDFVAVCVHKTGEQPAAGGAAAAPNRPDARYSCVIFLKREGAK